jgi:Tfp pilus assembly protein PilO
MSIKSIHDVREWIALSAGLAVAALIYAVLIQPPLRLSSAYDPAMEARRVAEEELADTRTSLERLQRQLVRDRARLEELGGSPPPANEKDLVIARVTGLANDCQLTVDRYLPIDVVDEPDHRAVFVRFVGRGEYHAIENYFRRFENEIDFADITHFSIIAEPAGVAHTCQLTWSCRINGLRPDATGEPAVPVTVTPGEVALR